MDQDELREALAAAICASDIRDADGRILYYGQADAVLPIFESIVAKLNAMQRLAGEQECKRIVAEVDRDNLRRLIEPLILRLDREGWDATATDLRAALPSTA